MDKLKKPTKYSLIVAIVGGTAVGFINGFFGSGGGMLVVPLLILMLNQKDKTAHATAIFIILPLSITSSVIYITSGVIEITVLAWCTVGVLVGGTLGALFLRCVNNDVLRIVFAGIMIFAGVKFII